MQYGKKNAIRVSFGVIIGMMRRFLLVGSLVVALVFPTIGQDRLECVLIEQVPLKMSCADMFRVAYNMTTGAPVVPLAQGYSIVLYMANFGYLVNEYGSCTEPYY